jgi:anti-sigma factor RsiW
MTCDSATRQLPLLLYGELSFDEEENLHQHLDGCETCQAELGKVSAIHRKIDEAEIEVAPALLADCRRNLRLATAAIAENGGPRRRLIPSWLSSGKFTWQWFGKPVSALTLIAMGFFGGRVLPVERGAALDPALSRVSFVEPRESGRVQIVLEETQQRVLSGDMEDDGIRSLVLRAARESSDPGVRVETMDLLKGQSESPEVRRALLHALRNDSNAGVRLKALEALRPYAAQEETRMALADVLLKDQNPGVRTQAVDMLMQKRAPEMVGLLQEIMTREDNHYIRMKVQRALADMNASAEMF